MIEHKTVSLADQVFNKIEEDILCGNYEQGEVLTESKLSAQLGVSRTPIREALRRLEQEHLIEESGKGSKVIGITPQDAKDIFLIRSKIEAIVASNAAKNHTQEQLGILKEAIEFQEFYLEKQNAERIRILDTQFHETIYKMGGSAVFYDVLFPLHKKIQKYRNASVRDDIRARQSVKEHREIYEAICDGDSEKAALLCEKHLENAYKHICEKGQ